ncbi:YD repeat-containing protein [Sphingopyxis panaciterrae]|uniref:RHS repeat protein n=1 Tax=Sphingopyxis panaciterrae TaxID=363841 RepID=UPI001424398D|nr:RHS repeat protein [Sphingopyxis panaciterrae]NIJ36974.1 YD repeat-containing protein [Sphingopyxis panaciterrae]
MWKLFGYDKNGNQTLAITSAGYDLKNKTFDQAFAEIASATNGAKVNATYTVYDKRGLATAVVEEGRQLTGTSDSQRLTTSRRYNAFGDVLTESDARGGLTSYAYNNIGKLTRKEGPTVEVTYENGATQWIKPATDYYYDKAGRLVAWCDANGDYAAGGTSSNGASKLADKGNLTRLALLAGTGYNGSAALVTAETHADGGVKRTQYDIHGMARTLIDEVGRTTTQLFDRLDRVVQVNHAGGLTDYYGYDSLGQRTQHWNNYLGSGDKETTDYDVQGRVTATRSFGGDTTTTSYAWDATIAAAGMGVITGGWATTASTNADRTSTSDYIFATVEKADTFGRTVDRIDAGGQDFDYIYDISGRLITENSQDVFGTAQRRKTYSYFNTGQIASIVSGIAATNTTFKRDTTTYSYDAAGNQISERLFHEWGKFTPGGWDHSNPQEPNPYPPIYESGSELRSNGIATYDALGRMIRYRDLAASGADNVDKRWDYDATGNVRKIGTVYRAMQAGGTLSATTSSVDQWYRYDSLNRVVTSKGILSGGVIVRGTSGTDLTYDQGNQRQSAQTGSAAQEIYIYNNAGLVTTVVIGGVTRATTSFDIAGNITGQVEKDASGTTVCNRYDIVYDARGLVLAEKTATKEGGDWIYAHIANYYSAEGTGSTPAAIGSASTAGTATGNLAKPLRDRRGRSCTAGTPGMMRRASCSKTIARRRRAATSSPRGRAMTMASGRAMPWAASSLNRPTITRMATKGLQ